MLLINMATRRGINMLVKKAVTWYFVKEPVLNTAMAAVSTVGATASAIIATKEALPVVYRLKADLHEEHLVEDQNWEELAEVISEGDPVWDGVTAEELEKYFTVDHPAMTHDQFVKDYRKLYFGAILQLGKIYLPTILLTSTAVSSTLRSYGIMKSRNNTLVEYIKAQDAFLLQYRNRVAKEVGEEKEATLFANNREITAINPDTGEEVTYIVKGTDDPTEGSAGFVRYFSDSSRFMLGDAYNENTILYVQGQLNQMLENNGYLFWNDYAQYMRFKACKRGQTDGWVYDLADKNIDSKVILKVRKIDLLDVNGDPVRDQDGRIVHDYEISTNHDGYILDKVFGRRYGYRRSIETSPVLLDGENDDHSFQKFSPSLRRLASSF